MLKQFDILKGAGNTDAGNLVGPRCGNVFTLKANMTGIGRIKGGNHVKDGGFAGTVWSDNGKHFALIHREADIINRFHATKAQAQIFNFKETHRMRSVFR